MKEKSLGELLYEAEVETRKLPNHWDRLKPTTRDSWERVALKFKALLEQRPEMKR